jgi:hypothetical protein
MLITRTTVSIDVERGISPPGSSNHGKVQIMGKRGATSAAAIDRGRTGGLAERAVAIDAHLLALDVIAMCKGREDWISMQGRSIATALQLWASMFARFGDDAAAPMARAPETAVVAAVTQGGSSAGHA